MQPRVEPLPNEVRAEALNMWRSCSSTEAQYVRHPYMLLDMYLVYHQVPQDCADLCAPDQNNTFLSKT